MRTRPDSHATMPQAPNRSEFVARYFVESPESLPKAAEIIAGEQSSGTFLELPGETDELKGRARESCESRPRKSRSNRR
ncbi:hypothetical protein GCM10023165_23790 [Variovorax defluvii]|uniref:Uncharacterized protein n=1 Tax=Variovorax defluvii TaxID=913761 RepID=A0ABP8HPH8_9BURK